MKLIEIMLDNVSVQTRVKNGEGFDRPSVLRITADITSCTATLVTPYLLLTAAHCVHNVQPQQCKVPSFPSAEIVHQHLHPQYDASDHANDVAFLELNDPILNVTPMTLVETFEYNVGKDISLLGWGKVNDVKVADSLQQAKLQIRVCSTSDSGSTVFCARPRSTSSTSNVCKGDSGGPAIDGNDGNGVIGVLSQAELVQGECAVNGGLSLFCKANPSEEWIQTLLTGNRSHTQGVQNESTDETVRFVILGTALLGIATVLATGIALFVRRGAHIHR